MPNEWTPRISEGNRRAFLRGGAALVSGMMIAEPLRDFRGRRAYGETKPELGPYGKTSPKVDNSTGLPLLALPDGFEYWSFGWTGDFLSTPPDAPTVKTPDAHDGMGVVDQLGSRVVLVRNHEVTPELGSFAAPENTYSEVASGGTTTLIWDTETKTLVSHFASLSGTSRNCAGGVTPWGSWITCEETEATDSEGVRHGFAFEVDPAGGVPVPIPTMGRFTHEAVAVDAAGRVYLTEDAGDAGFYRFTPHVAGNLRAGGTLEMLKVKGRQSKQFDFDQPFQPGQTWDVGWVTVPSPQEIGTFHRARKCGAARFSRLEGCWSGDNGHNIYFVSTDGGVASKGQVFCYDTEKQQVTLLFDSPAGEIANYPDNLTVTPRGGLLMCEDNPDDVVQRLLGLTLDGRSFVFAANNINFEKPYQRREGGNEDEFVGDFTKKEWAGVTYSADGDWLFVNIQTPGITFAITGPWESGPL